MPTYPLPTLAATVDANGISAPPFSDIYQSLQASVQAIYGADTYIAPDSQDGQLLAVFGQAISDCNDAGKNIYRSFSPSTAQTDALSSNVKINGIARAVATYSSATVRVVGVIGTTITNGIVADTLQRRWLLPASVVIPPAGYIDVTAQAENPGNLTADIGSINQIVTNTLGWQAVTNTTTASPGAPIETDAALRRRQTYSTALPSRTVIDGITGAIAAISGVTQVVVYENDTDVVDANGQPAHSIAAVVIGGDATAIATALAVKKTPGAYTHGSTAVTITGANGLPSIIRFAYATATPLSINITVKALPGYTTSVGDQIKAALVTYINNLGIGKRSDIGKLYLPAQFYGGPPSDKFEVDVLQQAIKPAVPSAADLIIPYNAWATLTTADINLTVT